MINFLGWLSLFFAGYHFGGVFFGFFSDMNIEQIAVNCVVGCSLLIIGVWMLSFENPYHR